MFDIGGPELLVILLGIIVLFGPKKIPEVAQMIGKGIQKVRTAQSQFKEQIDEIQTELAVVGKTDFSSDRKSPIKEINANELTVEHFSDVNAQVNSDNENQNIPNSEMNGINPLNENAISEPYKLDIPEKDEENSDETYLTGNSNKLQG